MVLRGQFLERPTVVESGGFFLEALSHRGESPPALLICPPHPLRGGSMDAPLCAELAFAATQAGHASLRFNYRGAGASQGEPSSNLADAVADARAALELLAANVRHESFVAAGYDFGAEVVVELALAGAPLSGLVLVAPDTSAYDFRRLADVTVPGLFLIPEKDRVADGRLLAEHCQRTGDQLVVVPEADRVFTQGLPAAGREVVDFLKSAVGGLVPPSSIEPIEL